MMGAYGPRPIRRAIGVVRVSQLGDRDRETFSSPKDQCDRMRELATAQDWDLTIPEPHEINVSGDALLEDRPQLSRAVMAVQTGAADVVVAAHTERLWWNHEVRGQVLRLVESAGGEVWSADEGKLSNGSASDEFSGTVRTAADRLSRRQNREKSEKGVQRVIAEGRAPWASIPVGYRRGADGKLVVDEREADVVREAFEMRRDRATFKDIRERLAAHGVERTIGGVQQMLGLRVYRGELHFGKYKPNLAAHEPIVEPDLFDAVQRVKTPRGPRSRSERLLAGAGLLRCAQCGSKMSISKANSTYWMYRCPPHGPCTEGSTIGADRVEAFVTETFLQGVRGIIAKGVERADVAELAEAARKAEEAYEAAGLAFAGHEDVQAFNDRLQQLRAAWDGARAALEQARSREDLPTLNIALIDDWQDLSVDERRRLLRAGLERIEVKRGRDPVSERCAVVWRSR
jgi:DNA invertase Pin-like site-specific DNA recombinase